jgi:hypothetical protein
MMNPVFMNNVATQRHKDMLRSAQAQRRARAARAPSMAGRMAAALRSPLRRLRAEPADGPVGGITVPAQRTPAASAQVAVNEPAEAAP